ncbi:MAG: DUF2067 family protein [Candidatus Hodarchaeota archaeon]
MGNVGRKKLYLNFDTDPESLKQIEEIKKKLSGKISMVIKLKNDKLEIDMRGSKLNIQEAILKIKEIIKS